MHSISVYEDNQEEVMEQFVLQHSTLVKKIALHIKRKLPSHVELDDLLQSGLVGLLEARDHYKHDQGTSFETYASIRIRGAIIDSLRKNSSVSRETTRNMRRVSEAISKIEQRNQMPATAEEIAKELGISLEDFFVMSQEINVCFLLNLDELTSDNIVLGDDTYNPQTILHSESIKDSLKQHLAELPEKERLVLSLYYVEELTFKEIGEVLQLSEARICQLHGQAIIRVRNKMSCE